MITEKTVFVLGAGASRPYGYPSGSELKKDVLFFLEFESNNLVNFGYKQDLIKSFKESFFSSPSYSVDAFLEYRPEFLEIGKLSIARALTKYEKPKALFEKNDWYQYLYNNHMKTPFDQFHRNKVTFITFNYDRSLEQFLLTSLQNDFGKSEQECAKKIESIPIIHVYGRLDYLPWQKTEGRDYSNKSSSSFDSLRKTGEGIKIINEKQNIEGDLEFGKAHNFLEDAKKIYFLGFGYDETNVKRLLHPSFYQQGTIPPRITYPHRLGPNDSFDDIEKYLSNKIVVGTAFNLEAGERERTMDLFWKYAFDIDLKPKDVDALLFLKQINL